jgi:hypothetical protein
LNRGGFLFAFSFTAAFRFKTALLFSPFPSLFYFNGSFAALFHQFGGRMAKFREWYSVFKSGSDYKQAPIFAICFVRHKSPLSTTGEQKLIVLKVLSANFRFSLLSCQDKVYRPS